MTLERGLSLLAFVTMCGFLAILVMRVPRLDLGLVVLVTLLLCGYDLFFHRTNGTRT
jgi:hypothetical protein